MNKDYLSKRVAKKLNVSPGLVSMILTTSIEEIIRQMEMGEKVSLVGFGTFEAHERAGFEGTNPLTGERMFVEPRKTPVFRASKTLKKRINNDE